MPKCMLKLNLLRKSGEKWGFSVNGGKDQSLTAKVGKVKVFTPADRAGLRQAVKMKINLLIV